MASVANAGLTRESKYDRHAAALGVGGSDRRRQVTALLSATEQMLLNALTVLLWRSRLEAAQASLTHVM